MPDRPTADHGWSARLSTEISRRMNGRSFAAIARQATHHLPASARGPITKDQVRQLLRSPQRPNLHVVYAVGKVLGFELVDVADWLGLRGEPDGTMD